MKKILAVVLTLCMLLSCLAVSSFAATREVTQDEPTTNNYWYFQQGNSWHPVKFSNPSKTVEMDIKLDGASSALGCYGLSNAPSIGATYVGLKDNSISVAYDFAAETWYNVKWVSADGSTEIFVNGESVGTVGAELTYHDGNQFYWSPVLLSMDNVKNGGQTFDFEGDVSAWNTESGQGMKLSDETPGAIHNNLKYEWTEEGGKYWSYDENNAYIYSTSVPVGPADGYTTITMKVRFNADNAETRSYTGSDLVVSPTKIGFGGNTAAIGPLSIGEWHEISINCYNMNNASFYKIDGGDASIANYDGIITGVLKSTWVGGGIMVDFDDMVIKSSTDGQSYTVLMNEDFEDGVFNIKASDGNGVAKTDVIAKSASHDLGLKYYHFQQGNSWHPVKFNNPSKTVELDIMLDDATSALGCYGTSNAPSIGASYVGLKDNSISVPYTFKPGTWYNVKWESADGKTTITVDGAVVGTVNGELSYYDNNQFYWSPVLLSMDNVKNGGQTFDFEGDNSAWNTESGQGEVLEYELINETIFDHINDEAAPGGNALLITQGYADNGSYYAIPSMAPGAKDVIVDFDLCLLPVSNDSTSFSENKSYYEFWLDKGCQRRVQIGTDFVALSVAGNKDMVSYDWGTPSLDNWHDVTVVLKSSNNKLEIYIDTELVYEGAMGTQFEWANDYLIGYVWNTNAIIDNYTTYALKTYDVIKSEMALGDTPDVCKWVNVDTDCSGWAVGHIPGHTARTEQTACYHTGTDETTCAVCGEVYMSTTVPMTAHKWQSYNINQKTDDGLVYVQCRNSGCPEKRYTTLPENYTGNLYQYFDMQDDMVLVANTDWARDTWTSADGCLTHDGLGSNYNAFSLNQEINAKDFSINLDIVYNGAVESGNSDQDRDYGHEFYFWMNGANTVKVIAGYSADQGKLFIRGTNTRLDRDNGGDIPVKTVDFVMNEGEAYNITYVYSQYEGEDADFAGAFLYVNGNLMVEYSEDTDYDDAIWQLPYSTDTIHYWIFRDFAVDVSIDNMAIGSADFNYTDRVYNGDLDGDYALTAADAVLMRKLLANVIDVVPCMSRVDANLDGAVNAKDQLVIRTGIAD